MQPREHTHIRTHVCMKRLRSRLKPHKHTYIYIYIHTNIHTHIHTYIHTNIHTYTCRWKIRHPPRCLLRSTRMLLHTTPERLSRRTWELRKYTDEIYLLRKKLRKAQKIHWWNILVHLYSLRKKEYRACPLPDRCSIYTLQEYVIYIFLFEGFVDTECTFFCLEFVVFLLQYWQLTEEKVIRIWDLACTHMHTLCVYVCISGICAYTRIRKHISDKIRASLVTNIPMNAHEYMKMIPYIYNCKHVYTRKLRYTCK